MVEIRSAVGATDGDAQVAPRLFEMTSAPASPTATSVSWPSPWMRRSVCVVALAALTTLTPAVMSVDL